VLTRGLPDDVAEPIRVIEIEGINPLPILYL